MAYQSVNPFTEELVQTFSEHTDTEVEEILSDADDAFRRDWRHRFYQQRADVLHRAAQLLRANATVFARLATEDMGKLLREAEAEVHDSADILVYYADHAERQLADQPIAIPRGTAVVENAPMGVIFCIEPWNYPYYQLARVAAPNLMVGNTVLVKHAPGVPRCAVAFEELFRDAGAPKGVYSNVFLSDEQAGRIVADHRVRGVALTGSERAGSAVAAEAGRALKKSTMELGGSDAFIVLDDADLDVAVGLAVAGRMMNSGQACAGSKRFVVHEAVADEFVDSFVAELDKLTAGDPFDPHTTLAPLSSRKAVELAVSQVEDAARGGATIILGGHRLHRRGFFLAPTVLADITPDNPAYYREFFAPVAMIFRVGDEAEAVAVANDSPFGLGGSVITTDLERAHRIAAALDTGMVFINGTVTSIPELPFGGVKNSGYGRELSDLGLTEFVNKKLVLVN